MVVRWDPFRDLMSIQGELNRLFDRTLAGDESRGGRELATASVAADSWAPALDVYEGQDGLELTLDLPGIDPDAVELTVEDSVLTISGRREFRSDVSEENYRRVERRYGSFARSLVLPPTADAEGIEATFDKGVLTIEVPTREAAKPKKIEIKASA
jgi:HSP20 family protein